MSHLPDELNPNVTSTNDRCFDS